MNMPAEQMPARVAWRLAEDAPAMAQVSKTLLLAWHSDVPLLVDA